MKVHFENENTFWVCPNFFFKKLRKLQLLQFYGCLGLPWRYRQLYVKRDEHDILTNFWQLLLLLSNMCHSTKKEIILHKWMCCSMATTVLYTLFFKLTLQDWDCPTLKLDFLSSCWYASFSPRGLSNSFLLLSIISINKGLSVIFSLFYEDKIYFGYLLYIKKRLWCDCK